MIKKGRGISAIMHPTGFKGGGDPDQALLKLSLTVQLICSLV